MNTKLYPKNKFGQGRSLLMSTFVLGLALLLAGCAGSQDGLSVGDPAPAFTAQAADGRTVSLDDYRDQPVLLYFHMALG